LFSNIPEEPHFQTNKISPLRPLKDPEALFVSARRERVEHFKQWWAVSEFSSM